MFSDVSVFTMIKTRALFLLLLIIFISSLEVSWAEEQAQPQTEPFYIQLSRSVFRLEHSETIERPGQTIPDLLTKPDGTAFAIIYRRSSDFSVGEFKAPFAVQGLCKALKKDSIPIDDETVTGLNELLRLTDLYERLIKAKPNQQLSENLNKHKESYEKSKHGDDLKRLNRGLLEEYYPQETPKSHDGTTYLITARHVAESGYDLRARVSAQLLSSGATDVIELRIPKEAWVFHPVSAKIIKKNSKEIRLQAVDIAVADLPGILDRRILAFSYCTNPCPAGQINQVSPTDPMPPLPIIVAGFPGTLGFILTEQRPMIRSGTVSMMAGERFLSVDGEFLDEKSIILDIRIQGGNSGSPVFNLNPLTGNITLVGVIIASNSAWEYAVAEPVSRVLEALEEAIEKPAVVKPQWFKLPQQ